MSLYAVETVRIESRHFTTQVVGKLPVVLFGNDHLLAFAQHFSRVLRQRTDELEVSQSNLLSLQRLDGVNTSQLQYVYGAEDFNKTTSVTSSVISWCINNQIDLDTRQSLVTASDVYRLQTAGRQVNVWTVNTIEKAYDLVNKLHVDMITTEYMLNTEP